MKNVTRVRVLRANALFLFADIPGIFFARGPIGRIVAGAPIPEPASSRLTASLSSSRSCFGEPRLKGCGTGPHWQWSYCSASPRLLADLCCGRHARRRLYYDLPPLRLCGMPVRNRCYLRPSAQPSVSKTATRAARAFQAAGRSSLCESRRRITA